MNELRDWICQHVPAGENLTRPQLNALAVYVKRFSAGG